MLHHTVSYRGRIDVDLDKALRAAIPGYDGSGFWTVGEPARDIEFYNDWPHETVEATARELCGGVFLSVHTNPVDDD